MPPCRHTSVAPRSAASTARCGDVVQGQQVRLAAQVQRQRALGEPAERALEGAHVGVVDVAVDHVGDGVPDRLPSQLVGQLGDRGDLRPAGPEQGDDLRLADLLTGPDAGEHLGTTRARFAADPCGRPAGGRRRIGAARGGCRRRSTRRWSGGRSGRPRRRCRRWRRPGAARARSHRGRRGPAPSASERSSTGNRVAGSSHRSGSSGELRVDRQPWCQRQAAAPRWPRATCRRRARGVRG